MSWELLERNGYLEKKMPRFVKQGRYTCVVDDGKVYIEKDNGVVMAFKSLSSFVDFFHFMLHVDDQLFSLFHSPQPPKEGDDAEIRRKP